MHFPTVNDSTTITTTPALVPAPSDLAKRLDAVVDEVVRTGRIVGTVVLVAHEGSVVYRRAAGWADREGGQPARDDTVFRLASMTKPIVSAAAMALVERGTLTLDDPVSAHLPWFRPKLADGRKPEITIRQLLNHTAGLSYGFISANNEPHAGAGVSDGLDASGLTLAENLRRLAEIPLLFEPGSSWCYSLACDVLGLILETVTGRPLPDVVRELVTAPLDMRHTGFHPVEAARLAVAYADSAVPGQPARRMTDPDALRIEPGGLIHYSPRRATDANAYPSGGAGMVGTADDYLVFLEAMRTGGAPILDNGSVQAMTRDAVAPFEVDAAGPGYGFGLGVNVLRDPVAASSRRNAGSWGWGGVYGTSFWVDPSARLSVVALTNTALEGLTGTFPGQLENAVYGDRAQP